jgi:hypothetical protein
MSIDANSLTISPEGGAPQSAFTSATPSTLHSTRGTWRSILFPPWDEDEAAEAPEQPSYFRDLNLDQIIASITVDKQEYNLTPFFYRPLKTVEMIKYRQDVMRDLENQVLLDAINVFSIGMQAVRDHIAQAPKLNYKLQKQAWSLDAIELYCEAVERLLSALRAAPPRSAGLKGLLAYLDAYVASPPFQTPRNNAAAIRAALASIRYNLLIGASFVTVSAIATKPIAAPRSNPTLKSLGKGPRPTTFLSSATPRR